MPELALVVAGRLDTRTGGSIYNRRMAEALGARGWSVRVHELDNSFPSPTDAALREAASALASLPSGTMTLIDGLAFGAMPDVVGLQASRLRIMPIVHLPLAAALGLSAGDVMRFEESERRALKYAWRVIVTGTRTFEFMREHALAHPDVLVVEPGTHRTCIPMASPSVDGDVRMLCVATLSAGKGHAILIDALSMLAHRRWRLNCAGNLTRHPAAATALRHAIAEAGLEQQVFLVGELNDAELDDQYREADFVVLPSLRETYSMAVADALACGRPVVATRTGAIPELVGDDAGIVVPPGDRYALATALRRMMDDPEFRGRCAAAARHARGRLRSWDAAAGELEAALTDPSRAATALPSTGATHG